MAVKAGTAFVDFEGDFSGLNKQVSSHFARITKNADKAGHKIGKSFGVGMAAGVGAAVVAGKQFFDFGKEAVNTASDINESLSKNRVLFGKYAKGIEGFSRRSADALGISQQAALEYTGTFGNLFTALGVNNKQSAKFSKNLVKLSADMASFNNSTPEEALEAIRSGLVGETEPLRKFGVNMNEVALKAEAMRMGLVKAAVDGSKMKSATITLTLAQRKYAETLGKHGKNSDEALTAQMRLERAQQALAKTAKGGTITLTAQQKALAAQSLITQQTSKAHGDFAKTSDQLANSQRRLTARWTDMKGTLGTALLPAVKNVTGELLHLADDVQPKVERAVKGISRIFSRTDLSLGDKLKASFNLAKLDFAPFTNKIGQGLKDAKLDDKLEEVILWAAPKVEAAFLKVGQRSASTWWKGFKEDPLWTVVGTGFIAAKLGLTGPLLKGLTGLFRGGGGFSKATPMPVFVVNAGGLGGVAVGAGGLPGEAGKGRAAKVGSALGKGAAALPLLGSLILTFQQLHADRQAKDLDHLNESTGRVKQTLTQAMPDPKAWHDAGEALQELSGSWSSDAQTDLAGMQRALDAMGLSIKSKPSEVKAALGAFRDLSGRAKAAQDLFKLGITLPVGTALDDAKTLAAQMRRMRDSGSKSIGDLRTSVRFNMRLIRHTLGSDSAAAREAISANFSAAISNVKKSMKEGTISVKDGTALIQTYMVRSLMNFGFSRKQALNVASDPTRRTSFTGGPEEGTRGPGHQRGGYINLGAPSGDSVHAMLERDEYVLNRKAVRKVGKSALDRLNFGDAPRFQRGGSVTGDTDFVPALMNALKALSASVGVPIYVQSGRRTVAEQLAQGPSTPSHPVAGPNGPHVRGVAADITPGYPVFGKTAGRFGLGFTVMPQEPWHIQLTDAMAAAGAKAVSAVAEKIAGVKVTGPGSALKSIAQNAIDATQGAAQGVVNQAAAAAAMVPGVGEVGTGAAASGNGADLMRQISKRRGWNFADWWALDASETGHGANLSNPHSSARLRGQFLDSNYGKYGPGSDPGRNPSMGQQIESMAAYIAERYGNPTKAWAWHQANNWYQRGGVVNRVTKLIRKGPLPSGKAINRVVNQIGLTSKKGKLAGAGKVLRGRLIDRIKGLDLPKSAQELAGKENQVNRFDDLQDHAGTLTDSGKIQTALEAQQKALGRDLTDAEQDKTIGGLLGRVQGHTQIEWLAKELSALGSWRNALIRAHITLSDRLQQFKASLEAARKRRDALHDKIVTLTSKRRKLVDKRKGTKGAKRKGIDNQIKAVDKDLKVLTLEYDALGTADSGGIIAKLVDKRDVFSTALTDANDNLHEVQGSVAAGDQYKLFGNLKALPIDRLLGTVFTVRNALETSGISSYRVPPSDVTAPDTTAAPDDPSKEILAELLRQANLRTAVSEAQFDVFKSFPFGGVFHQGGTVPGPVGAPRMILAQGGEVVIPNDASNAPAVSLHFANGMEWLRSFVDVRVQQTTRTQARSADRRLPGQAGVLR